MQLRRAIAVLTAASAATLTVSASPGIATAGTSVAHTTSVASSDHSAADELVVVTANAEELLRPKDLARTRDVSHLTSRIQNLLRADGTGVPDVLMLQEVTAGSANTIAEQLSVRFGQTFRVGVKPAVGAGAVASTGPRKRMTRRDTAIIHNAATTTLSLPATSLTSYPASQIQRPKKDPWLSLRQATALITKRDGGKKFAVYSAHFQTHNRVKNHDLYGKHWANLLKRRLSNIEGYEGATRIIAGDFNRRPCINPRDKSLAKAGYMTSCKGKAGERTSGLWSAMHTSTKDGPGVYTQVRTRRQAPPDNVFTNGTIAAKGIDDAYRSMFPGTSFGRCGAFYLAGHENTKEARAIKNCFEHYYSDHAFVWATIK